VQVWAPAWTSCARFWRELTGILFGNIAGGRALHPAQKYPAHFQTFVANSQQNPTKSHNFIEFFGFFKFFRKIFATFDIFRVVARQK
jgi:hypothetical protein